MISSETATTYENGKWQTLEKNLQTFDTLVNFCSTKRLAVPATLYQGLPKYRYLRFRYLGKNCANFIFTITQT
jgi:hypothetical protein